MPWEIIYAYGMSCGESLVRNSHDFHFFYLYTLFSGNFKLLNSHILFLHVCGHVECRRDEHIMNFSKSVVAVIAKAVAS